MQVNVHTRVHERILHPIDIFGGNLGLSVRAHYHFMSIRVNMALAKGDRLGEDIVARSKQIYKEDAVVFDQAEDALVIVASALRAKCDDNPLGGVSLDNALGH